MAASCGLRERAVVGAEDGSPAKVHVEHLGAGRDLAPPAIASSPAIDLPSYTGSVSMPSSRAAILMAVMVASSGSP